jgi:hypothetical protein
MAPVLFPCRVLPEDDGCGYLHHRAGPQGPFRTERVKVRMRETWPHMGMWEARFEGRWRKVRVQVNRTYIVFKGEKITIQIRGVSNETL